MPATYVFDLYYSWGSRADADANDTTATAAYAVPAVPAAAADKPSAAAASIHATECYAATVSGPTY